MALQYEQIKREFIAEFNLGVLAPEKQDAMVDQMTELLMKKILVQTMEKLGDTGMDEYEQLLTTKPTQEEIEAFLKNKIPEYDEMVQASVADFKTEMKNDK